MFLGASSAIVDGLKFSHSPSFQLFHQGPFGSYLGPLSAFIIWILDKLDLID